MLDDLEMYMFYIAFYKIFTNVLLFSFMIYFLLENCNYVNSIS